MNPYSALEENIPKIEKILGITFDDKNLIYAAFTHSSFLNEFKKASLMTNERLEFLGDSVLNLIITQFLLQKYPDFDEGDLTALRSSLVSAPSCNDFVMKLALHPFLLVGRGEQIIDSNRRTSILADFFEAILGAIFLDKGFEKSRSFFFSHFQEMLEEKLSSPSTNFKALLQEYVQKTSHEVPSYKILSEEGPDHDKNFTVGVYIDNTLFGQGSGPSKKIAQQLAAQEAIKKLQEPKLS